MRIITKIVFFHICIMDQSLINSWGGIVGGGGGEMGGGRRPGLHFHLIQVTTFITTPHTLQQHLQTHTPIYCPTDIIQTRIKHKEHFLFSTV